MTSQLRIAIIVSSTRPHRKARVVAEWVQGFTAARATARYELVDIADFKLPLLDEPIPPSLGRYAQPHTDLGRPQERDRLPLRRVEQQGGRIVSYGSSNGVRAVEHLRQISAEVMMADVRTAVGLSLFDDFENFSTFKPRDVHQKTINTMLEEVERWAKAMRTVRNNA